MSDEKKAATWIWGYRKKIEVFSKDVYRKSTNEWWDGYAGEPIVLIEDFDATPTFESALRNLEKWTDDRPFEAKRKGNETPLEIRPKKIVVTASRPPEEVFEKYPVFWNVVKERFDVVRAEERDEPMFF